MNNRCNFSFSQNIGTLGRCTTSNARISDLRFSKNHTPRAGKLTPLFFR